MSTNLLRVIKGWLKRWFIPFGRMCLSILLLLLFITLVTYYLPFPSEIEPKTVSDILRTLVEIDGIFIGFSGIIFAQMFGSLMDQQNVFYSKLLDSPSKKAKVIEEYLDVLEKKKCDLAMAMTLDFIFLILSIFEALRQIGIISRYITRGASIIHAWAYLQGTFISTCFSIGIILVSVLMFYLDWTFLLNLKNKFV